jgi:uncharacterized delta-60 repeat protein
MMLAGAAHRARRAGFVVALLFASLAIPVAAVAAPADLDRSFGGDGIVQVEGPGGATFSPDSSARMAIGQEGEIFVLYSADPQPCGGTLSGCAVTLSLVRYDRNGRRDGSFGTGAGSQLVVNQPPEAHSFALAVGPDGKPVVAASDSTSVILARFDRQGHLDPSFGAGGTVIGFSEAPLREPAVAVQADGKVLAAVEGGQELSSSQEPIGSDLLLVRYLPNGERDPGFGNGGEAVITMGTRSRPAGILLGADGSISVASPQCCGGSGLFGGGISVARLLADGRLDSGFAGDGNLLFPTPGAQGTVEAAALSPDGGIFTVLEEDQGNRATVGNVVKLSSDGTLDSDFGAGGRIQLATRVGTSDPAALIVDSRGRLVGVGWDGDVTVFRVRADGSRDRTFNGGQHVATPFGGNQEAPLAVGLQQGGRIVALGETSCCGPKVFALIGVRGGTAHTRCLRHKATIVGTRKADDLTGTPRRDVIAALGGNDKVRALSGADLICGGKGKDQILGGPGRDLVRQ